MNFRGCLKTTLKAAPVPVAFQFGRYRSCCCNHMREKSAPCITQKAPEIIIINSNYR